MVVVMVEVQTNEQDIYLLTYLLTSVIFCCFDFYSLCFNAFPFSPSNPIHAIQSNPISAANLNHSSAVQIQTYQ